MWKSRYKGIFAFLCMIILIIDSKTSILGAQEAIELCIKTIIPSLFPFFVLSCLITSSFCNPSIILRVVGKQFSLPEGSESLLITGFMGGYPIGAQAVSQMYRTNQMEKDTAERLLAFCSNAGPAFLFGILSPIFSTPSAPWILWGIHITGAYISSRFFSGIGVSAPIIPVDQKAPPSALKSALFSTATVCGWVILFRILLAFLNRWFLWQLPISMQVIISGLLELTNGCCELNRISEEPLRFVICSGMLGFGGICVIMQTAVVTKPLSLRIYVLGKIIQTVFSLAVSTLIVSGNIYLIPAFFIFLFLLSRKQEKSIAFPYSLMYNKPRIQTEEPPCCFVKK